MRASRLWLLLILLLALALRLYQIGAIALRADEAANLYLAAQEPADIVLPFVKEDPHLPLYHLVLHYWMLLAGQSELAVRFPTVLAGVLVVALTVALARSVFPKRRGIVLLAALFAACNPYLVWDAQDAYMYSFLTALAVGSWIALLAAIRPNASRANLIAYVVVTTVALYTHYLSALVLGAQAALWLYACLTRAVSRWTAVRWMAAQIAAVVLFVPWLLLALPLLAHFQLDFFAPTGPVEMLARSLTAFSVGRVENQLMPPMIDPLTGGLLSLGFVPMVFLGMFAGKQDRRGRMTLVFALIIPLLAIYAFSVLRFPIFDERYVLFLIPVFAVLIARGTVQLRRGWLATAATIFIILSSSLSLYNYFCVPAYAKSPDWYGWTERLMTESRAGDGLVQNYPDPALPYYLQNRLPRALLPRSSSDSMQAVGGDLDRFAGKFNRLWLQPAPGGTWDRDGLVATWFDRHARLLKEYSYRGVDLALYEPGIAALRNAQPVDARFGTSLHLLAYEWDDTTTRLWLYWRADGSIMRDATVFVHLYDKGGKLWSQQDNQPVHGSYPTSQWQPGEIVVDQYDLRLPPDAPAGTLAMMVGVYDASTMERWGVQGKAATSENRVLITRIDWTGGSNP